MPNGNCLTVTAYNGNGCAQLVSLDCHEIEIEIEGDDEDSRATLRDDEAIGELLGCREQWVALGRPYEEYFYAASVMRSTHPLVRLSQPGTQ